MLNVHMHVATCNNNVPRILRITNAVTTYMLYEFNCNRSIVNSLEVFSCLIIISEDFTSLVAAGEEIVLQSITHIESRICVYIYIYG